MFPHAVPHECHGNQGNDDEQPEQKRRPEAPAEIAWIDARAALVQRHLSGGSADDTELSETDYRAGVRLAETDPSSRRGRMALMRLAFDTFGALRDDGDPTNPDHYPFDTELERKVMRALLRQIAGGALDERSLPQLHPVTAYPSRPHLLSRNWCG